MNLNLPLILTLVVMSIIVLIGILVHHLEQNIEQKYEPMIGRSKGPIPTIPEAFTYAIFEAIVLGLLFYVLWYGCKPGVTVNDIYTTADAWMNSPEFKTVIIVIIVLAILVLINIAIIVHHFTARKDVLTGTVVDYIVYSGAQTSHGKRPGREYLIVDAIIDGSHTYVKINRSGLLGDTGWIGNIYPVGSTAKFYKFCKNVYFTIPK